MYSIFQSAEPDFMHLWLFGDCNNVNIPYRMLKRNYMPQNQRLQLSRAIIVTETIRERIGMSFTEITALGHVEAESYLILLIFRFLEIFDSMNKNAWLKKGNSLFISFDKSTILIPDSSACPHIIVMQLALHFHTVAQSNPLEFSVSYALGAYLPQIYLYSRFG